MNLFKLSEYVIPFFVCSSSMLETYQSYAREDCVCSYTAPIVGGCWQGQQGVGQAPQGVLEANNHKLWIPAVMEELRYFLGSYSNIKACVPGFLTFFNFQIMSLVSVGIVLISLACMCINTFPSMAVSQHTWKMLGQTKFKIKVTHYDLINQSTRWWTARMSQ